MELPKYSKMEIERRFLPLIEKLPDLNPQPFFLIEDVYISESRLRLRSITCSQTGKRDFKFCKKYDACTVSSGPIVNLYLTEKEFEMLSELSGNPIRKRRYHVEQDGRRWAVDLFLDGLGGLVLCEVEVADLDERLQLPPWAGKEVTSDLFFTGGALARTTAEELKRRLTG